MRSGRPSSYDLRPESLSRDYPGLGWFIHRHRTRGLLGLLHRATVMTNDNPRRAIVVFNGRAYPGGSTIVTWHRPEHRHCFVLLDITEEMNGVPHCALLDGQGHMSKLDVFQMTINEIFDFYTAEGCPCVETYVRNPDPRVLFPIWLDCVQQTKRFLGITKWFIWTPYQLLRYLQRENARRARQVPEAVNAPADQQIGSAQSD